MRQITLLTIAFILLVAPAAAFTIHARDITTNSSLNATINITYNSFTSIQETANSYQSCTNSTGGRICPNTGTVGTNIKSVFNNGSYYVTNNYIFTNYTIPIYANNNTYVLFQIGMDNSTDTVGNLQNSTISSCIDNGDNIYQERFYSQVNYSTTYAFSKFECYNGSAWVKLGQSYETSTNFGSPDTPSWITATTTPSLAYNQYFYFNSGVMQTAGTFFLEDNDTWYTTSGGGVGFRRYYGGAAWESQVGWNINSTIDIEIAPLGSVTPAKASNYSTANITVTVPGYGVAGVNNVELNITDYYFNMSTASNTTFYFFNENGGALLSGTNISISLSGRNYGYFNTTTNGSFTFVNLSNDYYLLTYNATNFTVRQFFSNLPSSSNAIISLYLLPSTASTTVQISLLGETYQPLDNGLITAQKKNISGTNYYSVAQCTTDNNGKCLMDLELYTTTYKFITNYLDITRSTNNTQLSANTFTIVIDTRSSTLQDVIANQGVTTGMTYDGAGSFTYTVHNANGGVQRGSMVVNRRYGGLYTTLGTATGTGTSFTITVGPVNTTVGDEIIASGYVDNLDDYPVLTQQATITNQGLGTALGAGSVLLFIALAFTLVFIFAWNPVAPMVIFAVLFMVMARVGLISLGGPAIISIFIVVFVGIYRMRNV